MEADVYSDVDAAANANVNANASAAAEADCGSTAAVDCCYCCTLTLLRSEQRLSSSFLRRRALAAPRPMSALGLSHKPQSAGRGARPASLLKAARRQQDKFSVTSRGRLPPGPPLQLPSKNAAVTLPKYPSSRCKISAAAPKQHH